MKLLIKASVSLLLIFYVYILYKFGDRFGGIVATAGIAIFIFGGLYEFYELCKKIDLKPLKWLGLMASFFIVYEAHINNPTGMFQIILGAAFLSLFILILDKKYLEKGIVDISITIFGLTYVAAMLGHLILVCKLDALRPHTPSGLDFFVFIVVSNAIGDMSANGIGSLLGKRKFLSHISPKKTVEGTVGGCLMAVLTGIFIGYLIHFPLYHSVLAGLCIGISGIIGDFGESLFKRNVGVKDAGTVFVEHGGMLDRCDSLFLSTYLCYLYLKYIYFASLI